ncbi:CBS domain-containing protein [Sphingopyxis yananensis]|uniref:CBS domain-containing protein n=1 Tax=Sphingopyxis yananensis TaxID=2886687 RepID=UPI001D10F7AB|nr:CBS domain-containing protein [Sphingopyxis yananensis]MCC2601110.1 CBS domain-containing protein [Sphingopyxis yananensis]
MTIASILQGRTQTIISGNPTDTVQMAVDVLAQHRIGAIPIVDQGRVVGIFSERDFVRLISSYGPEALNRPLNEVMTQSPVSAEPQLPIMAALSLMTQKRIRHLPVVDANALIGFISIGDLVKYRIDKIESEAAAMREYIAS